MLTRVGRSSMWRMAGSSDPALKIEAGLRYEYNANLVAQSNQTSDIDLSAPGGPAFVVAGNPSGLACHARVRSRS